MPFYRPTQEDASPSPDYAAFLEKLMEAGNLFWAWATSNPPPDEASLNSARLRAYNMFSVLQMQALGQKGDPL